MQIIIRMLALLVILGTFTSLIARMPRSGQWLVIARRGIGILMLLCGAFFLVRAASSF